MSLKPNPSRETVPLSISFWRKNKKCEFFRSMSCHNGPSRLQCKFYHAKFRFSYLFCDLCYYSVDPDPHHFGNLDPHQLKIRIGIRIKVISRIRIHIYVIRIHNTALSFSMYIFLQAHHHAEEQLHRHGARQIREQQLRQEQQQQCRQERQQQQQRRQEQQQQQPRCQE